ncbi:MAG: hemerythrin domain-containing protein [Actinomycetota bacterium]|nr:hemerythrin domain-containing protein [Actinomycetota bacterium]
MVDALEFIRSEHEDFRGLLNRYEEVDPDDHSAKRDLVAELITVVVQHSAMEERAFYPAVREHIPELDEHIREGIEEHHVVEVIMQELKQLDATDEQFDAKVEVFAENLLHHIQEEEDELFPKIRSEMPSQQLEGLADDLRAAKEQAPTEPKPSQGAGT